MLRTKLRPIPNWPVGGIRDVQHMAVGTPELNDKTKLGLSGDDVKFLQNHGFPKNINLGPDSVPLQITLPDGTVGWLVIEDKKGDDAPVHPDAEKGGIGSFTGNGYLDAGDIISLYDEKGNPIKKNIKYDGEQGQFQLNIKGGKGYNTGAAQAAAENLNKYFQ